MCALLGDLPSGPVSYRLITEGPSHGDEQVREVGSGGRVNAHRQRGPGAYPKCAMTLESVMLAAAMTHEYTCPMHPEIVRPEPGVCPICGMALEPRTATIEDETNPELRDMSRRFWVSLGLTLPLLVIAMAEMVLGVSVGRMALRTAFYLGSAGAGHAGRPLGRLAVLRARLGLAREPQPQHVHPHRHRRRRRPTVTVWSPPSFLTSSRTRFRSHGGEVGVYFEAAAVITTLVLLGQVLELRARQSNQ